MNSSFITSWSDVIIAFRFSSSCAGLGETECITPGLPRVSTLLLCSMFILVVYPTPKIDIYYTYTLAFKTVSK